MFFARDVEWQRTVVVDDSFVGKEDQTNCSLHRLSIDTVGTHDIVEPLPEEGFEIN